MNQLFTNLKDRFKKGSILIQLIYINVGIFIVLFLLNLILTLFQRNAPIFLSYLELPASFDRFFTQPWSIITYMFIHFDIWHILFNMLCLYWFGELFLQYFSAKHLRGLYLLGGLCGGLLYMISFNIFPYFNQSVNYAILCGASASVLAIIAATAVKEPNIPIRVLFIGNIRLKYVAVFMILFDLFFMLSNNAGGHLAHLGGALSGVWFALGLSRGYDATKWINNIIDIPLHLSDIFHRKPKMKVKYGGKQQDYDFNERKRTNETDINHILEKIKLSGYGSLTSEEKKELFDASKK